MSETKAPKTVKVETPDPDTVEILGAAPPASVSESEIKAQIDVAKRYPRDTKKFLKDAITMVTLSEEIAESCIYSLARAGENIAGKSVRLAEICMSAWGNIHAGARPIEVGARDVTSQGVCWDVERNVRVTMETKRRITNRNGQRYSDDMIATTQGAASSIALRNAILRVIPSAFTDEVYRAARACAVGEGEGAFSRRSKVMQKLGKMGAPTARILAVLGRDKIEDVNLDDVEILIGFGTAIKDGEKTVDEVFPPLEAQAPAPAAAQTQAGATPNDSGPRTTESASPQRETTAPASAVKGAKQGTLADVAARTRGAAPAGKKNVDDVIGGPRLASVPSDRREMTIEEQDAADRAAAAPTDDEPLPPWSQS